MLRLSATGRIARVASCVRENKKREPAATGHFLTIPPMSRFRGDIEDQKITQQFSNRGVSKVSQRPKATHPQPPYPFWLEGFVRELSDTTQHGRVQFAHHQHGISTSRITLTGCAARRATATAAAARRTGPPRLQLQLLQLQLLLPPAPPSLSPQPP